MKTWKFVCRLQAAIWWAVAPACIVVAGCQAPPVVPTPTPVATPAPVQKLSPAEAHAQSAKLALDAMELLQNGDEPGARNVLDSAILLDASNEVARKLLDQIKADPQKELGTQFFRYAVKSEDTLSKLAQRFLGDRYRFYILAKYNDLRVPNKLEVGQVIKIPGREPPPVPVVAPPPVKAPEVPARPPETQAHPPEAAPKQKVEDKDTSIRRLNRQAEVCYQRDRDLDCAIQKWGQVLELDPNNQLVKLKRERAIALREQLNRDGK